MMRTKPRRRALFIVNPRARNGLKLADDVRKTLEGGGLILLDDQPGREETVSDVIIRRRSDCDLVVLGGGDGTLNSSAKGLVKTGLPLGIVPLGTANDFAKTVGIPSDPVKAAALIVSAKPRPMDLGDVNGQLFFNVASIGFSAELAAELSEKAKKRFGKLGYTLVAARLLARSRLFTAYLEHDGSTEKIRTLQVSVGNGKYYGGGMSVEETATADDGQLDFYSLEVDHWWRLLTLLPSLRKGTQGKWDDVRAFATTELVVKTSRPRPVNTDGELTTWTPAYFKILESAIHVYAPPAVAR
ncbi:MAG: lipid kinase [Myxococcota bacterium]